MKVFIQKKEDLVKFLTNLDDENEVICPIKTDVTRFEITSNFSNIEFNENAFFPVKEFFFKQKEILFTFDGNKLVVPNHKNKQKVFFGIRRCDLNAIKHQDMVFDKDVNDPYYKNKRNNTILIGYHCQEAPTEYCFCESMDLVDFFDLMYYDRNENFLVEVGSDRGMDLIKNNKKLFRPYHSMITQEEKKIEGTDRLKKVDLKLLYNNSNWEKGVKDCLSCSACTALCPTCYCFSIHDEVNSSDPSTGTRSREWSSCQVQEFTRVAGDHVFRKDREERFKHRIYHQLDYFKDKYGENLCVGCGRCISGCPTRIDFVKIINEMEI